MLSSFIYTDFTLFVGMSKFGETADRILDILQRKEKVSVNELVEKIPIADREILDLMNEGGLIEVKKGEVRITVFGSELLTVK
ncbi:Uncharacterised protein [uncultured archaeon]|nr:Uncharacterised protein [uncultured archaeon]